MSGKLFTLVLFALMGAVFSLFLQSSRQPVLAVLTTIATGCIVFLAALPYLTELIRFFADLAEQSGVNTYYVTTLLKIIGIAYLAEFAVQLCRDAGQGAIALKVEFVAKIGIIFLAMPVIAAIFHSVLRLLA